jgi:hypothetical protein
MESDNYIPAFRCFFCGANWSKWFLDKFCYGSLEELNEVHKKSHPNGHLHNVVAYVEEE